MFLTRRVGCNERFINWKQTQDELLPVDIYNLVNCGIIFFAALYGVLFENDEEAAFSNYRLWESAGFIIAFILQTQVSDTKMCLCHHHFKYFG